MHVNRTHKTPELGTAGWPAKCLTLVLFLLMLIVFFIQAAQAVTTSSSASLNQSNATIIAIADTKNNTNPSPAPPSFTPKLTLSHHISSIKLSSNEVDDSAPTLDPLMIAARSQPSLNRSDLAVNGVLAAQNNKTDLIYQAKKEHVEKAMENENKVLIAFILIFVTAIVITYVVTRNKPLV